VNREWPHPDYDAPSLEDVGPSVEAIASAVETGLACAECGVGFVKAHGVPTVCSYCGRRLLEAECGVKLATHAEASKSEHETRARARKQRRAT
jgi:hypothetical protein